VWAILRTCTKPHVFACHVQFISGAPRVVHYWFTPTSYKVAARSKGASTLLVLVLVLARFVLVGRLVWLLLVHVNHRPHYLSCSPGFGAWGSVYLLVVCIGCSTSTSNVKRAFRHEPSSSARTLGSWVQIPLQAWMSVRAYSVCVVLCVGGGLDTGWSPVQGVLPTVYSIKNLKKTAKVLKAVEQ
jgi:hypothetical protein